MNKIAYVCMLAVSLAACNEDVESPSAPRANEAALQAEQPVTAKDPAMPQPAGEPIDVSGMSGSNEPVLIDPGQTVTAEFSSPAAGSVTGVGVQLGNFEGKSDGQLKYQLCQGEKCVEASVPVAGSVDNDVLPAAFATPLVVDAVEPLRLTITRIDGSNPLVIWSYPDSAETRLHDGSVLNRALRIRVFTVRAS